MKNLIYIILFFSCYLNSYNLLSQKDSFLLAIQNCSQKDSAYILNKLSIAYRFSEYDSALMYANLALKSAIASNNIKEQAHAENAIGVQNHLKSKYDVAMRHYIKALKLFEKINYANGIASATQNIGIVHFDQGNLHLALKYYKQAAELYKQDYKKGVAAIHNNIAMVHMCLKDITSALKHHHLALDIRNTLGDSAGISSSYGGLAIAYYNLKEYSKAIEFNEKKIQMELRFGNERELATTYNNLGDAYLYSGNYDKAKECFEKGISVAMKNVDYYALTDLYYNLSIVYERTNKFQDAFNSMKEYMNSKDSLFKIKSTDKVIEMETQYQTEKKELKIKNQLLEITSQEKENKQKSKIILLGALALIGTGFFAAMAFINFRKAKKAKIIIENQKLEVELKNEEVTHQKEIVEEKQKEIIDSINYAKRIQQAVLTGEDVWNKVSKEHFILFKPKDIVSGDFYWAYNTPNNRSVFALADCTGHGVPGGFMSMLGNSFLNEIVIENKIFKANEILNKLRSKIISALEQKGGTQQKDGMDISLCVWNKLDNTLEFAGANNQLWIIKTVVGSSGVENKQLLEYKADKMPIGTYLETEVPFSSVTIQLQKGDIIYLSTDGYADQFGGPKGKKFKYKPLIESLIVNSANDMSTQKTKLEQAFNLWQGSIEQVDDVAIIGVKVS